VRHGKELAVAALLILVAGLPASYLLVPFGSGKWDLHLIVPLASLALSVAAVAPGRIRLGRRAGDQMGMVVGLVSVLAVIVGVLPVALI